MLTSFSYIETTPPEKEMLIVGTPSGPYDLDPIDAWDRYSDDVIRQVNIILTICLTDRIIIISSPCLMILC